VTWRLLVLDTSDPDDPRWLLCTVGQAAGDVRPAVMEGRRYADWPAVTEWVREQVGEAALVPLTAIVWGIEERGGRESRSCRD
jgi:hypothetical protein